MRQTSHTAAGQQPPPSGDELDALRERFPYRRIWRGRRENGNLGDYYAATAHPFSDKEIERGGVKTVVAATAEELRELLVQQPDALSREG